VSRTPGFRGRYKDLTGTDPDRLEAISDGIFSVGMTLLVLGLTVPLLPTAIGKHTTDTELWTALRNLAPKVLIYILSFMTLGIFWVAQGSQTALLARSNRNFAWIQLTFLFTVTLVPFSTALLANYYWLKLAVFEYWLNIVLLGATIYAGLEYGVRAKLFREENQRQVTRLARGRIYIAQSLYAIATLLCLVFPTWVSIGLIFLVQLNYVLAPRIPILDRY
jgi:uncharacterized membrane protein